MAKKKSQDADYTRFSLPQPHHPSTQPKANSETAPPETPPPDEAQSAEAQSAEAEPGQAPPQQAPPQQSPSQESAVLRVPSEDGVVTLTMNRPDRLNAISPDFIADFVAALGEIAEDRAVRAVVLTGAGRAFCSGADLKQTGEMPEGRSRVGWVYDAQLDLAKLMLRLYELPQPVIAAVNGPAVGGGLAIALHCDVRLASPAARFGSVFIKVGLSSLDVGTSYLLPKIVGIGHARELMLTGKIIDSEEAARIGLANRIVPADQLLSQAQALAAEIASNNEYGVWMTKTGLNAVLDAPSLRHALEIENRTQVLGTFTGNMAEASKAFREGRPPNWNPY